MDKQRGILNVVVSIVTKVITMILAIVVKRLLIRICGNEINGLNALLVSVIGFLSVAELGIGSAITFCMYKPVAENKRDQVAGLLSLFKKAYFIVGIIIMLAGLMITPFIHILARDYANLNVALRESFVLMLISVVITYAYSAKISLLNAYKNNYIATAITSGGMIIQQLLQIVVLYYTHSFIAYVCCRIAASLIQWIATDIVVKKPYSDVLHNSQTVDAETKATLTRSIKAMFLHKVGYLLVNTADSIVISYYVGVAALGRYSNYTMILASMTGIINLLFTSLTSVIGHFYVTESREKTIQYCNAFHFLNFVVAYIFYLGYYSIIDNLVVVLFTQAGEIVNSSVAFILSLNGFVQFMRTSVLVLRDATGTFYHDRWKPFAEGIVNLILSILFVKVIGVAGVILGTLITNVLICHVIEPYVLFRFAFNASPKRYYLRNGAFFIVFLAGLMCMNSFSVHLDNRYFELLANGFISILISVIIIGCVFLFQKDTLRYIKMNTRKGSKQT